MSYKNSENFYGGNASNTGWLVASDAYYSDPDPNCKVYHLNNNGKLTDTDVRSGGDVRAMQTNGYAENIRVSNGGLLWLRGPNASGSDIYISQGGAIYVQSGAKITNLEILDGGTVNQYQGTYTNMIVHAGGRAVMGGYNQTPIIYNGLTVETGATFTTYPGFIMMGNITIAQGTWTNDADAYALNGNICHLNRADNAKFRDGITLSNYTQTAGTVSISSGAAVDNGTITGGVLNVSAGATVDTITQNGGTLNAEAGTVKNLTYNAGTLTVAAGVTVENFNQTANTVSFVNGVILKDATLGGGTLNIANGVTVNGLTYNAGTLNLSSGVTVNRFTYNGAGTLDIKSGATIDGGTINGNLNFRKGATGNNITITTGQVQYDPQGNTTGTDNVYGENIRMTGGTLFVKWAGTVVSNVQVSGGILYGRSGGIVRDVDVYSGGQIYVRYQDSATFSGATVHSSGVVSQFADMRTEFADLTVEAGGKVYLNNFFTLKGDVDIAEGAEIYLNGTRDADVTAENGTIYNLNNKLTGFFASGITLSNYTQTAGEVQLTAGAAAKTAALTGGTLRVLSGATGDGITVSAGNMYVSDGGRIDNIVVHSGGNLHLSTGAQVFGLAVSGNTANGLLNMYAGGYVSGATVSANKGDANIVYMYGGGLMEDVTFEKAGIFLSSGGTLRNVTQRDGAYVILRGENPYVSGARVSGGTLFFQNGAKGKNIVIVGGNMQVQDCCATNVPGSGAYESSKDLVTGTINVSAGGRIDDLRASGGTVNITSTNGNYGKGATLSGAVFTGGTLNITGNALVEAADIGEDAAVTITGGNLYVRNYGWNITQTGGTVHVAADATVTGVTQTAGSLDIGVGATVKNYEKNGTEAVRLANNATVDGGVMYAGQLNARVLDSVANATVKNYTMRGNNATYLIVQGAGNSAENIAVSGGSLCIQAYATARNIDVYAGGVINTPSHQPGSYIYGLNIHDGGSGDFTATNSNKRLEIYDLNMEDGATLALRLARVSRGTISGGTIKVDNALFYDVTMSGGQIFASGGVIFDKGVGMNVSQTTGQLIVRSGAAVYNVDISGNELYIQNGSIISGAIVRDGAIFYTQSGTVYDLTLKAGASVNSQSWGMGAVTLDGIDVETGATLTLFDNITLRGDIDIAVGTVAGDADAYAEDGTIRNLDISGSVLNVQSGITLDHLNIGRAGRIVATDAAITNFDIEAPDQTAVGRLYLSSGAVASGGRLNGTGTVNAIYMTDGAKLNEMHVSDGGIFLSANAELTNLEMTGGIVILRGEQTYISGATVAEGALHIQNGGDGDDITVAGGSLSVTDTTHTNPMGKNEIVNDVAITAGAITVGSGGTINRLAATGGTINVSSAGTLNSVTVGNKATLNVSGGTANSTTVNLQGGMYVYSGGTANSTTVNAMGGMHVSGGVANSTIVNSYGNMHVRSGGTVNEATVNSSGTLYVSSGVANSTTVNSRGNMNISSGGVANAITVNSGNLYVFESGVANSTTANGGNLYLFSGGTINGLTATSGTVNVFSGGTINNAAVTNTLNDLQVFEGATVNYKENKGVALLQGSNTNIAASTFHYNGAAEANGFSVENGVVKNLGEDGKAYRLTVGDGIVVENATINSGWRISAVATAVVSGGLAYGSGAEGVVVMRDSSYAVGMTLSGVGGSAQSGLLNLWDNASAAEIIVSNGGVLRMNDSRNAVSGTTVLSGGTLFFINSGSVNANGATMEDTTIKAGGRLMLQNITTLNTGDLLTIDFTGTTGNQSVAIDDLSLINAST
ncbi:MAG: hypothetical protein J6Y54_08880, partial [Lentisphaeria bacterium]|nr:hypothetical protein [Lentisphaeria bacterium]